MGHDQAYRFNMSKSLFMLEPLHPLRLFAIKIVTHQYPIKETVILFFTEYLTRPLISSFFAFFIGRYIYISIQRYNNKGIVFNSQLSWHKYPW